jgi:hypothetical protein
MLACVPAAVRARRLQQYPPLVERCAEAIRTRQIVMFGVE